jgi:ferredoxin
VQLECIACTACIDACDDVMIRMRRPTGLIRYGSLALAEGLSLTPISWTRRPRAWTYLLLLSACLGGLAWTIGHRVPIEVSLVRAAGEAPYQEAPTASGPARLINHFKVDLRNQTFEVQDLAFTLDPRLQSMGVSLVVSNLKTRLAPGEPSRGDLFVQFPATLAPGGRGTLPFRLGMRSPEGMAELDQEVRLVGPLR